MIASHQRSYGRHSFIVGSLALCLVFSGGTAIAAAIEVFHADSLAGPMKALKGAFETRNPGAQVNLTTGRSQELAERILKGDVCDVFTPSAPAVIEKDLMTKKIAGTGRTGASWSVIFSANEMVVITTKGNPFGIKKMSDLAKAGVRFTRVTGEKDMATQRTIDFVKNVTALEGNPQLAQGIIGGAVTDPAKPHTVPETIGDITTGKADAGVVYYSAAVEAKENVDSLRFPSEVNLSSQIRNAATIPSTAKETPTALSFVRFILSDEGCKILEATGQPPIVPPITHGEIPPELK
jgi:molybdate transport system substrate-binding protein